MSHIHLALEQGVYYALIGQTGSGKSTLIQHINGLIKPTTGSLSVGDITIHHKTKDKHIRTIRKTVGMVSKFQKHNYLKIQWNVKLSLVRKFWYGYRTS